MRTRRRSWIQLTVALVLGAAVPAAAHHRQTPPVTALTGTGDNSLPRLPAFGINVALALPQTQGTELVQLSILQLIRHQPGTTLVEQFGTATNPASDLSGGLLAWDSTNGLGRQVYTAVGKTRLWPVHDPTGTSANPAVDRLGTKLAFESNGDLAGNGNTARQIFYLALAGGLAFGNITQVSTGSGTSLNPSMDAAGRFVAFQSTSDPTSGADTGIPQIWTADVTRVKPQGDIGNPPPVVLNRLTSASGPSSNPNLSDDGQFVVFQSTADLAGDGHDTGVTQIFAYHIPSGNFAQATNDPGGCRNPGIRQVIGKDWHLTYVCGGTGYLQLMRADQRARLPIAIGDTSGVLPDFGLNFVIVATTAACVNCGQQDSQFSSTTTTSGHQVYLLNLFKRHALPVAGSLQWFPSNPF